MLYGSRWKYIWFLSDFFDSTLYTYRIHTYFLPRARYIIFIYKPSRPHFPPLRFRIIWPWSVEENLNRFLSGGRRRSLGQILTRAPRWVSLMRDIYYRVAPSSRPNLRVSPRPFQPPPVEPIEVYNADSKGSQKSLWKVRTNRARLFFRSLFYRNFGECGFVNEEKNCAYFPNNNIDLKKERKVVTIMMKLEKLNFLKNVEKIDPCRGPNYVTMMIVPRVEREQEFKTLFFFPRGSKNISLSLSFSFLFFCFLLTSSKNLRGKSLKSTKMKRKGSGIHQLLGERGEKTMSRLYMWQSPPKIVARFSSFLLFILAR